MSVLICIPTYENITPETFKSIYGLEPDTVQGRPMFDFVKGYGCAQARNKCANEALNYNFDYLMFVDSDIILPCKTLIYMLEGNADIVLGVYPRKNSTTGQTEIFLPGDDNFTDKNNLNISNLNVLDDRITVKGGGLGCALIKCDLIRKMNYPYFRYVEYDDGSVLSEDNYFCWTAGKLGANIQCDTRVRCKHKFTMWHNC